MSGGCGINGWISIEGIYFFVYERGLFLEVYEIFFILYLLIFGFWNCIILLKICNELEDKIINKLIGL